MALSADSSSAFFSRRVPPATDAAPGLRFVDRLVMFAVIAAALASSPHSSLASAQATGPTPTPVATDAPVSYSVFRRDTFAPLASQIAAELTPCGCTTDATPPTFTFSGTTRPYVTYEMLNEGTRQLLTYMKELMTACSCGAGVAVIDQAMMATPHPDSQGDINDHAVLVFTDQIGNVMGAVISKCCDPTESGRQYHYIPGSFTMQEAIADAQQRGGRVATIASRSDCMKATSVLRTTGATSNLISTPSGQHPFVWMGLEKVNGVWQWPDSTMVAFTNWGFAQPEAGKLCTGFCVATAPTIMSTWATVSCSPTRLPYLLELPADQSEDHASETTIIVVVIAVLVVLFIVAVIFIVVKRFVPACREKSRPGRRVTRVVAEERTGTARHRTRSGGNGGRRRRHRSSRGGADEDDIEGEEMTAAAAGVDDLDHDEDDGGIVGTTAHVSRRRRRNVNFPERSSHHRDNNEDVSRRTAAAGTDGPRQRTAAQRGQRPTGASESDNAASPQQGSARPRSQTARKADGDADAAGPPRPGGTSADQPASPPVVAPTPRRANDAPDTSGQRPYPAMQQRVATGASASPRRDDPASARKPPPGPGAHKDPDDAKQDWSTATDDVVPQEPPTGVAVTATVLAVPATPDRSEATGSAAMSPPPGAAAARRPDAAKTASSSAQQIQQRQQQQENSPQQPQSPEREPQAAAHGTPETTTAASPKIAKASAAAVQASPRRHVDPTAAAADGNAPSPTAPSASAGAETAPQSAAVAPASPTRRPVEARAAAAVNPPPGEGPDQQDESLADDTEVMPTSTGNGTDEGPSERN